MPEHTEGRVSRPKEFTHKFGLDRGMRWSVGFGGVIKTCIHGEAEIPGQRDDFSLTNEMMMAFRDGYI